METFGRYLAHMRSQRIWSALGVFLLAGAVLVFLFVLYRGAVNIPRMDDYDAVLNFLLKYRTEPSAWQKTLWVLTSQHMQYKLAVLHAVAAAEYELTSRVDFTLLEWLGNATVLLSAFVLWRLLGRSGRPLPERIWLFVPVLWVLLAPEYFETLDWAMGGLQNLTVIAAALGSLALLTRPGRGAFAASCGLLLTAIFCSGNGFMVAVAGALVLLLGKQRRRITAWGLTALGGALLYGLDYSTKADVPARPPMGAFLINLATTPFVFLGSGADVWRAALPGGVVLVVLFAWLTRRGWHRREPASFAVAVFILLSALLVALGRYGTTAGLASRYKIYSLLLAGVLWIGAVCLDIPLLRTSAKRGRGRIALVGLGCVLFSLVVSYKADRLMGVRKQLLLAHLRQWEAHPGALVLVPDEDAPLRLPQGYAFRKRVTPTMREAVKLRLYVPPEGSVAAVGAASIPR